MLKGKGLPVSKGSRFRPRFRAIGAGGAAALGAGVLLASCSPPQMGAAAIVGNQRIEQSTLATHVTSLRDAAGKYPSGMIQLPSSQFSQAVLSWLVTFQIEDRTMRNAGITLSQAQIQNGVKAVKQEAAYDATQSGLPDGTAYFVTSGIAPSMIGYLGQFEAQEAAFLEKANGGKPLTQADTESLGGVLDKASCRAAKQLDIQVNPQYGRLEYGTNEVQVVPGPDVLSKSVTATPAPASTTGTAKPAC